MSPFQILIQPWEEKKVAKARAGG